MKMLLLTLTYHNTDSYSNVLLDLGKSFDLQIKQHIQLEDRNPYQKILVIRPNFGYSALPYPKKENQNLTGERG